MLEIIKKYLAAGLSIIPVEAWPVKKPLINWTTFQARRATDQEADQWKLPIACIGGNISGGITTIDFDNKGSEFKAWTEIVKKIDKNILDNLVYQQTPSGGYHVVFKSSICIRNSKLAQRKALPGELDKDGKQARFVELIETRGEGGYFLISPSENYVLKKGNFLNIPFVSEEGVEVLISSARSLNQLEKEFSPPKEIIRPIDRAGKSPLDDYDSKNTPLDVLQSHGWKIIFNRGDTTYLCRPGKERGVSATWNHVPNRFYVFTSNSEFDNGTIYKASAVYAILENNRDFVKTANDFIAKGYGEKPAIKQPVNYDTVVKTQLVKMSDYKDKIYAFYKSPREAGRFLKLDQFDKLLRFEKGYLNVITGIPTHGKSEILDFFITLLAINHDWKFVIFSPENYPLEIHYNKLAEKFHGKSMLQNIDEAIIQEALDFQDEHFRFINATEEDLNLDCILSSSLDSSWKNDCLVIDPWNEIENMRPKDVSESDYTGICLRKLRKFARKNNVCIFVVAHPTKMYRIKDVDKYPVPTLYDISGSSNWYNKADNGIVVHRDFENDITEIYVKKVKFKNYGQLGMVQMRWNKDSGMYTEITKENQNRQEW
jgi:hypothetical protein